MGGASFFLLGCTFTFVFLIPCTVASHTGDTFSWVLTLVFAGLAAVSFYQVRRSINAGRKTNVLASVESFAGYVYILRDIEVSGFYKIGRTKHIGQRLNKFGVELPFRTEVVHLIQCTDEVRAERTLHERYATKRKRGEWFDLSDSDIQAIKKIERM
jgi:hypothetical protein